MTFLRGESGLEASWKITSEEFAGPFGLDPRFETDIQTMA
jgi:hypothetical protein